MYHYYKHDKAGFMNEVLFSSKYSTHSYIEYNEFTANSCIFETDIISFDSYEKNLTYVYLEFINDFPYMLDIQMNEIISTLEVFVTKSSSEEARNAAYNKLKNPAINFKWKIVWAYYLVLRRILFDGKMLYHNSKKESKYIMPYIKLSDYDLRDVKNASYSCVDECLSLIMFIYSECIYKSKKISISKSVNEVAKWLNNSSLDSLLEHYEKDIVVMERGFEKNLKEFEERMNENEK